MGMFDSTHPKFSGCLSDFPTFVVALSSHVASVLPEASLILEGHERCPIPYQETPSAQEGSYAIPLAIRDTFGKVMNESEIHAAAHVHPHLVVNRIAYQDWRARNTKLYGIIMESLPNELQSIVHHATRNDGIATFRYLQDQFTSEQDVTQLCRELVRSVVSPSAEVDGEDVRRQANHILHVCSLMSANGMERPRTEFLQAVFDNAMPASYAGICDHVRTKKHNSFIGHFTDYLVHAHEYNAHEPSTPRVRRPGPFGCLRAPLRRT